MGISDTMFSLGDMWWMGNLAKVEREREGYKPVSW